MLFGVEGLQVTDAESGADGTLEVWAVTDHAAARACPDCGTVSDRVHEQVLTRPRDVARGLDAVQVWWVKRRWKCQDERCERKTFTEWVPQVRGWTYIGTGSHVKAVRVGQRGCPGAGRRGP